MPIFNTMNLPPDKDNDSVNVSIEVDAAEI